MSPFSSGPSSWCVIYLAISSLQLIMHRNWNNNLRSMGSNRESA